MLKRFTKVAAFLLVVGLGSCQKEEMLEQKNDVSQETLDKIYWAGFGTDNVEVVPEGYLVEGDIILTEEQLNEKHDVKWLRVGNAEQYHTTNLVKAGTGRVITISVASTLPASYIAALDEAMARYNAEGLLLTFRRVTSKANISITAAPSTATYLANAGFPTSTGNPYNNIMVNVGAIGNQPQSTVASILAHEIGHCIGFRHTDYMDRSYSCGGAYSNEGAGTGGAINIPGTPSTADPFSWMLACIASGQNLPFNANDKVALNYLY